MKLSLKAQAVGLSLATGLFVLSVFPETKIDSIDSAKRSVRSLFVSVGLGQNWNMFSPDPPKQNVRIFAKVILKSGEEREWRPPGIGSVSATERYLREHWRKWSMDNLRVDKNDFLWPRAAAFVAESALQQGESLKDIDHVELWREWYEIPFPQKIPGVEILFIPQKDITQIPWSRFKFYEKRFD